MVLSVTAAFSHFLGEVLSNRFSFLFLRLRRAGEQSDRVAGEAYTYRRTAAWVAPATA